MMKHTGLIQRDYKTLKIIKIALHNFQPKTFFKLKTLKRKGKIIKFYNFGKHLAFPTSKLYNLYDGCFCKKREN